MVEKVVLLKMKKELEELSELEKSTSLLFAKSVYKKKPLPKKVMISVKVPIEKKPTPSKLPVIEHVERKSCTEKVRILNNLSHRKFNYAKHSSFVEQRGFQTK